MATLHSTLGQIQGKLDQSLHARLVNGKNILARNPRFSKKRWQTEQNWARSRENAYNFAAQSITASAIHRGLGHLKRHTGPYAHNAILSAISPLFRAGIFGGRQAVQTDPDSIARHLLALDLSPRALAKSLNNNPDGKLTRLPSHSDIHPGETLAFRLHTIHVDLQPLAWDENSKSYHTVLKSQTIVAAQDFAQPNQILASPPQPESSDWMTWDNPTDFPAITAQGLQNNRKAVTRGSNDLPSITFTVIEWRASRGNRHRLLHACNSFFVSAVTLSQSAPDELLRHTPLELADMKRRSAPQPSPYRQGLPCLQTEPALSMAETIQSPAFQGLKAMSDCVEPRSSLPVTPLPSPYKPVQHPPKTRQNSVQSPLSGTSAGQSGKQGKQPAKQPTIAAKRPSKTTKNKGLRTAI